MFDGVEAAINCLTRGGEAHQALATRLQAILHADCISCSDLFEALGEIQRKGLLPEAAVFNVAVEISRSLAETVTVEQVGHPEDDKDECVRRRDDLAEKLTGVIDEFLRSHPLPAARVEQAIRLAAEQYDHSALIPKYDDRFSRLYALEVCRQLADAGFANIAEIKEKEPQQFRQLLEEGSRFLYGMGVADRELAEFKTRLEGEALL